MQITCNATSIECIFLCRACLIQFLSSSSCMCDASLICVDVTAVCASSLMPSSGIFFFSCIYTLRHPMLLMYMLRHELLHVTWFDLSLQ